MRVFWILLVLAGCSDPSYIKPARYAYLYCKSSGGVKSLVYKRYISDIEISCHNGDMIRGEYHGLGIISHD